MNWKGKVDWKGEEVNAGKETARQIGKAIDKDIAKLKKRKKGKKRKGRKKK